MDNRKKVQWNSCTFRYRKCHHFQGATPLQVAQLVSFYKKVSYSKVIARQHVIKILARPGGVVDPINFSTHLV